MNALPVVERRAIPEARMAELRRLALSPDEAERCVAKRELQKFHAERATRDAADANQQEAA